jgi:hypothetical protein
VLAFGVVGVVAYFFATTLIANWERVAKYPIVVDLSTVSATVIFALAVVVSGVLWARVLHALGERHIDHWSATEAHLGSWLVRYIPSVAQPLYKVNWASGRGVRRATAFLAFLYEFAFVQLASILGSLVVLLLARASMLANDQVVMLSLVLIVTGVAGIGALRYAVNPVAARLAKARKIEDFGALPAIGWGTAGSLVGLFTLPRIVNGIGVVLLTASLLPGTSTVDAIAIAAAYTIAGAIGVLWVFVPSGLGVREATFVAILASLGFNVVDAIALSVVARLCSTIADLVVAGIFAVMKFRTAHTTRT